MKNVYITQVSKFLPNDPISNEEMEGMLGMVGEKPSKSRAITLRSNKIKTRYYAIKEGKRTHTNAQIASEAIKKLFNDDFKVEDLELLACGTTSPDQILPSHAAMVHGLVGGSYEIISTSGACLTGTQALKYAYMALMCEDKTNAVVCGSERTSAYLQANKYRKEAENLKLIKGNPYIAFEKDFLRWMLSDGAGALLLQTEPHPEKLSLKIEWIDMISYANEQEVCMSVGGMKNEEGTFKGWLDVPQDQWNKQSIFTFKQDVRILGEHITKYGVDFLIKVMEKRKLDLDSIHLLLPHISSYFFLERSFEEMKARGLEIPIEKWFTNLGTVGNVGSASAFIMIEEVLNSNKLKKGQKILLMIPESARFSFGYMLLSVV